MGTKTRTPADRHQIQSQHIHSALPKTVSEYAPMPGTWKLSISNKEKDNRVTSTHSKDSDFLRGTVVCCTLCHVCNIRKINSYFWCI